ncbi:hypothetical protein KKF34_01085 [Myxococcota bacterium]|nr:hypothetical protein [Myxococcota bacterium]MBU1380386.1 hypothetical protein [Myxococcota bacterium]MBU1495456.1 hypothetical protein [Myxococcota bacterium]
MKTLTALFFIVGISLFACTDEQTENNNTNNQLPECGNGIVEPGEDCDSNASSFSCAEEGFFFGAPSCSNTCTVSFEECSNTLSVDTGGDNFNTAMAVAGNHDIHMIVNWQAPRLHMVFEKTLVHNFAEDGTNGPLSAKSFTSLDSNEAGEVFIAALDSRGAPDELIPDGPVLYKLDGAGDLVKRSEILTENNYNGAQYYMKLKGDTILLYFVDVSGIYDVEQYRRLVVLKLDTEGNLSGEYQITTTTDSEFYLVPNCDLKSDGSIICTYNGKILSINDGEITEIVDLETNIDFCVPISLFVDSDDSIYLSCSKYDATGINNDINKIKHFSANGELIANLDTANDINQGTFFKNQAGRLFVVGTDGKDQPTCYLTEIINGSLGETIDLNVPCLNTQVKSDRQGGYLIATVDQIETPNILLVHSIIID